MKQQDGKFFLISQKYLKKVLITESETLFVRQQSNSSISLYVL